MAPWAHYHRPGNYRFCSGNTTNSRAMAQPNENFKISQIGREFRQILESLKNKNFAALFFYSLFVGAALVWALRCIFITLRFFFEFTGTEIAITGLAILVSPPLAICWFLIWKALWQKGHCHLNVSWSRVVLYPIPYIAVLNGFWPALGSTASIAIYTSFIFIEVTVGIVGAALLDSMMADIVEDSEKQTNRRSEGLFFAARSSLENSCRRPE